MLVWNVDHSKLHWIFKVMHIPSCLCVKITCIGKQQCRLDQESTQFSATQSWSHGCNWVKYIKTQQNHSTNYSKKLAWSRYSTWDRQSVTQTQPSRQPDGYDDGKTIDVSRHTDKQTDNDTEWYSHTQTGRHSLRCWFCCHTAIMSHYVLER